MMRNVLRENKWVIITVVGLVCIFAYILYPKNSYESQGEKIVTVIAEDGKKVNITVEIADSPSERTKGLSNRKHLAWNKGMLFVYEQDVEYGFWMKDTSIPLSIAFIDHNEIIIDIQQMTPNTTESHKPNRPYRYALEVNQGFFHEHNIREANQVKIPSKYKN